MFDSSKLYDRLNSTGTLAQYVIHIEDQIENPNSRPIQIEQVHDRTRRFLIFTQ